jgi:hypothetical protein
MALQLVLLTTASPKAAQGSAGHRGRGRGRLAICDCDSQLSQAQGPNRFRIRFLKLGPGLRRQGEGKGQPGGVRVKAPPQRGPKIQKWDPLFNGAHWALGEECQGMPRSIAVLSIAHSIGLGRTTSHSG